MSVSSISDIWLQTVTLDYMHASQFDIRLGMAASTTKTDTAKYGECT